MNRLVPQARLRYSTCSAVGFILILCAVFMLKCLLSGELEQVYQRARRTVKGSLVGKIDFPDHVPERNDLHIPWMKHWGFSVRVLEPCGIVHAHLHTSSRSRKHLLFSNLKMLDERPRLEDLLRTGELSVPQAKRNHIAGK